MTELKETISKNLRKYRKQAKISQTELAKQLGISPSSVSNWEQGLNSIDIDTLFRVCKILDVPISSMTDSEESPQIDYALELSDEQKEIIEIVRNLDPQQVKLFKDVSKHILDYMCGISESESQKLED